MILREGAPDPCCRQGEGERERHDVREREGALSGEAQST